MSRPWVRRDILVAPMINDSIRERLDLQTSIQQEAVETPDGYSLLPRTPLDAAATDEDVAGAILAHLSATIATDHTLGSIGAPVVSASKWRFGRRPAMSLTFPERVLYRSLVAALGEGLAAPRSTGDHETFIGAPIRSDARNQYVVITDIGHYYATMNLELLAQELVDRTGQWEIVRSIEQVLRAFSPRTGGLPQGNRTSDRLADTYIETLGHRLTRAGIECWWYADDFRIVASDYASAVHALDVLDNECRRMGLFINERKTWISSRARYEQLTKEPATAFTKAWEEKREELLSVDPYSAIEIAPDDAEVFAGVALDELEAWSKRVEDFIREPGLEASARLDLGSVLALLRAGKEPSGLRHIPALLRVEPQHTPQACKYLGEMLREGTDEAWAAGEQAIRVESLTDWQRLWLLDSFSLAIPDAAPWEPQDEVRDWTLKMHRAANEILRTHAVWVTGVQGQLEKSHWESAVRHATPYGQPSLAAASALVSDLSPKALYTDVLSRSLHAWTRSHYVENE